MYMFTNYGINIIRVRRDSDVPCMWVLLISYLGASACRHGESILISRTLLGRIKGEGTSKLQLYVLQKYPVLDGSG
jgi:hypothetical protein